VRARACVYIGVFPCLTRISGHFKNSQLLPDYIRLICICGGVT